jgi:predicted outer membrane repeat protein
VEIFNAGARFTHCVFSGNQAMRGGAVAAKGISSLTLENCSFVQNTADKGGGLFFDSPGPSSLQGCTFAENTSPGGAHLSVNASLGDTVTVDRCIFAFGYGSEGILWDQTGFLELTCVDIFGNTGGDWVGVLAGLENINGNLHADPLFCGGANPENPWSLNESSPCAPENNPGCGLVGAYPVGCGSLSGSGQPAQAAGFSLGPCYPNPFNPTTNISFALELGSDVFLGIYDARGELVRTLVSGFIPAGHHREVWHGRNDRGLGVSSGIYFARIDNGRTSQVRKMVLLR